MSDKATPPQMRQSHHVPDESAAKRDNHINKALWATELWQKIKEVPETMSIDDYVDYFVPSDERKPLPPCPPVGKMFTKIGEGGLSEKTMYPPLVSAWDVVVLNQ